MNFGVTPILVKVQLSSQNLLIVTQSNQLTVILNLT